MRAGEEGVVPRTLCSPTPRRWRTIARSRFAPHDDNDDESLPQPALLAAGSSPSCLPSWDGSTEASAGRETSSSLQRPVHAASPARRQEERGCRKRSSSSGMTLQPAAAARAGRGECPSSFRQPRTHPGRGPDRLRTAADCGPLGWLRKQRRQAESAGGQARRRSQPTALAAAASPAPSIQPEHSRRRPK